MIKRVLLSAAILAAASAPAFAHLDPMEHGSLAAGFSHPLFGLDHILAMLAVGLWAAQVAWTQNTKSALWLIPAAFVLTMGFGFICALAGIELPFVEPAILASVIALGLLVAMAVRLPVPACAAIVAVFAFFHGHAHGGELGVAGAWSFGIGFMIATALLHLGGIGIGLAIFRLNPRFARLLGTATALLGLSLAFG